MTMPQLPPTYFVLLDYAQGSPPDLGFPETPAGQTLDDVLRDFRDGAWLGQPMRVFRAGVGTFCDVSLQVAQELSRDKDPDDTTKDFIERHIPPSFQQIIGEDNDN